MFLEFISACLFVVLFINFIVPLFTIIFLGFLFLFTISSYIIYVFFIRAPYRTFFLLKEGKIKSSFTRSKELWYKTHTWKQWIIECFKSDIATLKFVINF